MRCCWQGIVARTRARPREIPQGCFPVDSSFAVTSQRCSACSACCIFWKMRMLYLLLAVCSCSPAPADGVDSSQPLDRARVVRCRRQLYLRQHVVLARKTFQSKNQSCLCQQMSRGHSLGREREGPTSSYNRQCAAASCPSAKQSCTAALLLCGNIFRYDVLCSRLTPFPSLCAPSFLPTPFPAGRHEEEESLQEVHLQGH